MSKRHDRRARLQLARPVRGNLPAVLRTAIEACALIVQERARFPELGSGKGQKRFAFTSPNRERDVRRLEAICLVLQSILCHTDLVTLRSGRTRKDGSCDSITNETIQRETRLPERRVRRALRDLRSAGFVDCKQPRKKYFLDDGAERWRAYPVVRTVTARCFARLGISPELLQQERSESYRRQREAPTPIVDIRVAREHQRIVRAQQLAAKRAGPRRTEAEAAAKLRELEARIKKRTE